MLTQELRDAVLDALRPQGLVERLRHAAVGGYAPVQVLDRLPEATREALQAGHDNPVLARRAAVEAVTFALDDLIVEGVVARRRVRLKSSLVDVYRQTRTARPGR